MIDEAAALSARSMRMTAEADLRNAGYRLPDKTRAAIDTTSRQTARAHLDNAVTAERASADDATTAATHLRACTQRRETATRTPQPSSHDLTLLERADTLDLPAIHEQLPDLHRAVAETDATLQRLRTEHEKLVKKIGETRFGIERDIVANATVVATTLAMLTLKKVITDKPFDHVIVDERLRPLHPRSQDLRCPVSSITRHARVRDLRCLR